MNIPQVLDQAVKRRDQIHHDSSTCALRLAKLQRSLIYQHPPPAPTPLTYLPPPPPHHPAGLTSALLAHPRTQLCKFHKFIPNMSHKKHL